MNEKDKAMQEEKKEVMDGVMSDDELDAVGGGIELISRTCMVGQGDHDQPEGQVNCACMDGLGSSHRFDTDGEVTIEKSTNVEIW